MDKLTFEITITKCRGEKGGVMHLMMADTTAVVRDDETGERLGSLGACIGGGFEFAKGHDAWFISYPELWDAFEASISERAIDQ